MTPDLWALLPYAAIAAILATWGFVRLHAAETTGAIFPRRVR